MAKIKDDYSILRSRIVMSVLILYGVSFVVVFIYALFTFPEKSFLRLYRAPWTLYQAVLYFIGTLIPMQCTAVLLTCSFTAPPIPSLKTGPSESFSRLVSSTIGVIILLSIGFVVLSEGLAPTLERRLDNLQYRTIVLRNYYDLAETSRRSGDLGRSEKYLEYYLHEYPGDPVAADMLSEVRKQFGGGEQEAASEQVRPKARLTELDPAGLLVMAKSSFSSEEYFTAYYFANLAADMSPFGSSNKEEAVEITSAIQERLSTYKDDKAELERKALFEVKTQGFSDLSSSDVTLNTKAYYTFLVLSQRYPEDPEPRTYLNQSIEKLSSSVFFLSEVEDILSMPGLHDLFFVNSEPGAPIRQLVSIGKVIEMENGTYARDIESVSFDADGSLLNHQRASVGKIMNTGDGPLAIYMRGIDPDDSTRFLEPEYLALEGDFPSSDNLVLRPDRNELEFLGDIAGDLSSFNFFQLWGAWDAAASFGYPSDTIRIETITRLVRPFGFLILSLASIGIGWLLRPESGVPSVFGILFIPAFPFAAHFIVLIYEYLHRVIIGSTLIAWGFIPALIIFIAIEFILIVISIFSITGQSLQNNEPG